MLYGSVDNSDTVCSEQSIVVTDHFTFLRNIEKAHSKFHCIYNQNALIIRKRGTAHMDEGALYAVLTSK